MMESDHSTGNSLLDHVRTSWLAGRWDDLTDIAEDRIESASERSSIALFVASAYQYQCDGSKARQWLNRSIEWGASRTEAARVVLYDAHRTLGRIATYEEDQDKISRQFKAASELSQQLELDAGSVSEAWLKEQDKARDMAAQVDLSAASEVKQQEPSSLISREDVYAGFRLILGREPESEEAIQAHLNLSSISSLREKLLASEEFTKAYSKQYRKAGQTNVLNLDAPRIIFMHLPKTGGSTMHNLLGQKFEPDEICPERWNYLRGYTLEELSEFRFFSGHFDYQTCQMVPGRNNKIITCLREPKSRLVSLYYFERAHRPEIIEKEGLRLARLANEYSILDFFKLDEVKNHTSVKDSMVSALVGEIQQGRWEGPRLPDSGASDERRFTDKERLEMAKENLLEMHTFGILEDFERSVALVFKKLGFEVPDKVSKENELNKVMNANEGLKPVEREPPTAELEAVLESLTTLDRELYEFAEGVFKENLIKG